MPPARLFFFVVVVAALVLPVFAHGCHGDDVDHEPGFTPPATHPEPELRP
ncbi:MAG: hypothetical protein JWO38_4914 [Gemmataceae bacterium]|nr:hypothetical protein [Gemmataceae bacterium]